MWPFKHQVTIKESQLLEGFTDWHCHLLPGVDDGVKELSETLGILHTWEELGVSEVWFTPHIMEDIPNETAKLRAQYDKLRDSYHGPIRLHLAAENMLDDLFCQRLASNDVLPLAPDDGRLLVETSYFSAPYGLESMLADIKSRGYYPVLAHPERYQYMDKAYYKRLKDMQVLFQLNIGSLVGAYGKREQQKAEMLLSEGYYDLCGTDTHSAGFVKYLLGGKLPAKRVEQLKLLMAHD